ncbi:hypothetical protein GCM10009733_098580 [Nonomuraea maheshkhaliensis]|uniref:Uncharacterized protein n=1 Tax=Nonomuraea maheshkhaliensis TaxID=419590 RepID=A0ABN2HDP1_9ACTN
MAPIDVPSPRPRFVRIEKALITVGGFLRTRDGKGLVVRWGKNGRTSVRRYDLKGAVERTWHVRGRPVGHGLGTFSPSGRRFGVVDLKGSRNPDQGRQEGADQALLRRPP